MPNQKCRTFSTSDALGTRVWRLVWANTATEILSRHPRHTRRQRPGARTAWTNSAIQRLYRGHQPHFRNDSLRRLACVFLRMRRHLRLFSLLSLRTAVDVPFSSHALYFVTSRAQRCVETWSRIAAHSSILKECRR